MNIAPLILVARSLSRMPSAVAASQCGTRWCSGNSAGKADRPGDHGVVGVAGAVGRVGVRQVGDAQQQVAHLGLHGVVLGGQHTLVLAEGAAAGLQLLGLVGVAGLAQRADLLRQLVHLGADGVALGHDVAGPFVE